MKKYLCVLVLFLPTMASAGNGDRLQSPVAVGQGLNVTESVYFDQGLGSSNSTFMAATGGAVGAVIGGGTPSLASSAAFYVSAYDYFPAFAIERTGTNPASFAFQPYAGSLSITGLKDNITGLVVYDGGGIAVPYGGATITGTVGITGNENITGNANVTGDVNVTGEVIVTGAAVLEVATTDNSTTPEILVEQQGTANGQVVLAGGETSNPPTLGTLDSTDLKLITNNTEIARLKSSGLVGIGSASPVAKLDVVSTATDGEHIAIANDSYYGLRIDNNSYESNPVYAFELLQTNAGVGEVFNATYHVITFGTTGGTTVNGTLTATTTGGNVPYSCVLRATGAETTLVSQSCSTNEIATGGGCSCPCTSATLSVSTFTGGTSGSVPPTGWTCTCSNTCGVNNTASATCCRQ